MRAEAEEEDPRRHPGGKENEDAASGKDRSGAAAGTRQNPREADDDAPPRPPRTRPAAAPLPYLPRARVRARPSAPQTPPRRAPTRHCAARRAPPPAPSSPGARMPSTRRGPLREEDLFPRPRGRVRVPPQCRSSVFPPPGRWPGVTSSAARPSPGSRSSSTTCTGTARAWWTRRARCPSSASPPRSPPSRPSAGKRWTSARSRSNERRRRRRCSTPRACASCRLFAWTTRRRAWRTTTRRGGRRAGARRRSRGGRRAGAGSRDDLRPLPPKPEMRSQRHFRGHADDVRCLTVHETTHLAASGDMGVEPCVMVWCVDERGGHPPLARLRHCPAARAPSSARASTPRATASRPCAATTATP